MKSIARCSICDATTQPVNQMNSLSYTGFTESQVLTNTRAESHVEYSCGPNGREEVLCGSCEREIAFALQGYEDQQNEN